jgi:probable F420-dependent oxidoreductase
VLIDATLTARPSEAVAAAADYERQGFDGVWMGEAAHDSLLLALAASMGTGSITVGTSVTIAFARSPMTVASAAWDLADASSGRFVLGLGTQVRAHIERRFSMTWSAPARRLREFVLAVRAIWAAWADEAPLDFTGEFYTHTLMTPFFTPEHLPDRPPPIHLAGVGDRVTRVAGEVADGFFFHAFTTAAYLQHVTLPALEDGLRESGRARSDLTVCGPVFVVAGDTDQEFARADRATRQQIAFYGSTPAYAPVLAHHGWADAHAQLRAMARAGAWTAMADVIDDEMLDAFAVRGTPEEAGRALAARFGSLADRVSLHTPYEISDDASRRVVASCREVTR